jgi:hypothetical protein
MTPQPPKALAYRVLLSVKEQPPVLLATTRSTTYIMNDLEPNTTYRVQVQVESEGGLSQKNSILKFTTKLDSDKTVSKHQQGQAPLGMITTRPGTSGGPGSGGNDEMRLPSLVQKPGTGIETTAGQSGGSKSKRTSPTKQRAGSARDGGGNDRGWQKADPYGLGGSGATQAKARAESASAKATRGSSSPPKDKELYHPQPPVPAKGSRTDAAPRRVPHNANTGKQQQPSSQKPGSGSGGGTGQRQSPQRAGTAGGGRHGGGGHQHEAGGGSLPPLAVRRGAPPGGGSSAAVEEYDVVGFNHSDDERN